MRNFFSEYLLGVVSLSFFSQVFNIEFFKTILVLIIQLLITLFIRFLFDYFSNFKNKKK